MLIRTIVRGFSSSQRCKLGFGSSASVNNRFPMFRKNVLSSKCEKSVNRREIVIFQKIWILKHRNVHANSYEHNVRLLSWRWRNWSYFWIFGRVCLTIKCKCDGNGCKTWPLRNSFLKDAQFWGECVINIRKDLQVGVFDSFDKEE
jgi:hypothetical protein